MYIDSWVVVIALICVTVCWAIYRNGVIEANLRPPWLTISARPSSETHLTSDDSRRHANPELQGQTD